MAKVNNVTRYLDSHKIEYIACELPAEKLGAFEVAQILNVSEDVVFKTIVILREGKGKPVLAIVPGGREVDLKALARAVNEKKVSIASQTEAEKITKLLTGGISPLALLKRGFKMVIDQSALELDWVYISGGERGLNIRIAPQDLMDLIQAQIAVISH
jgi:Cys-tRNA(Pro)/Cys-tRNA(Cys) deacylase